MPNMTKTILQKKRELVSKPSIEEVSDIRNTLAKGNQDLAIKMVITALFERDTACHKLLHIIENLQAEIIKLKKTQQ